MGISKAGESRRKLKKKRLPVLNLLFLAFTGIVIALSVCGPELLTRFGDQARMNEIHMETAALEGEGYRYALSNGEKLYILAQALNTHQARNQAADGEYRQVDEAYAFIENYRGPSEKQITGEDVYLSCSREVERLKELGILPEEVLDADKENYTAVLYSAIDVLEPRNNIAVWKLSLTDIQKNVSRKNKLMDVCMDADNGKIYEFYVRTEWEWADINPDEMIKAWSRYMELEEPEKYEADNPLAEPTPFFEKYRYLGSGNETTIVTIGFYEGINELFLKVSR